MDEGTAFRPEELRATDLLQVRNVTHRRVVLERFDLDHDAGGDRQLLSVPRPDEPLHVLRANGPTCTCCACRPTCAPVAAPLFG